MKKTILALLTGLLICSSLVFAEVPAYQVNVENVKEIEVELVNEIVKPEPAQQTEQERAIAEIERIGAILRGTLNHEVQLYMIGEGVGSCTGVLIKNDETGADILTAKHCSTFGSEVFAEGVLVTSIEISTKDDIALFRTDEPIEGKTATVIASENAKVGSYLYGVGKPVVDPYPLYGKVIIRAINNDYAHLSSIPGTSGAGLMNDKLEIVGILWGGIESSNITVYSNVSKINRFLTEINYVK